MRRMKPDAQYEPLRDRQYYIDKTQLLEKGMEAFPSIYIEGAAASGKTTAAKMMLARHPEVEYVVFRMDEEQKIPLRFCEKLKELRVYIEEKAISAEQMVDCSLHMKKFWVIFENLPCKMPPEITSEMVEFLNHMPEGFRAVLIGRERPEVEFLKLIWKRKMELFPQEILLFTQNEIRQFAEDTGSPLDPEEIYAETGGWAGCVDMMLRMSQMQPGNAGTGKKSNTAKMLRESYEIDTYIQKEILDTLSEEEQEMMRRSAVCPWIDQDLCRDVWGIQWPEECLDMLNRKGMLVYDSKRNRWKTAPLFRRTYPGPEEKDVSKKKSFRFWIKLGHWYESRGFIKEALYCLKISGEEKEIKSCMIRNYSKIPFLGVSYDEVMEWKENLPEICYLRGMYCYFHQNMEGLEKEISRIKKNECSDKKNLEILLNLTYVKSSLPLEEWLDLLETYAQKAGSLSLYAMLGSSLTYLCGLRDLSGLFACTKKEENRKMRLWRECLGEDEYIGYCLARFDYYLEIRQMDALREEDWDILKTGTDQGYWQFRLARLYLLCKIQGIEPDTEAAEHIRQLQDSLLQEEDECCVRNSEVIGNFYFYWNNEREKFSLWLLRTGDNFRLDVNEENYYVLFCLAKGYMLINQYPKAEKILRKLIPYLQFYRRTYLAASCMFQQAVESWEAGNHSQALRNTIESFIVNGDFRYVRMYTEYGKKGCDVLEAYVEWIRSSRPEGWHRKKKYNYGNVLRMPLEDYLEAVLRYAKREARSVPFLSDSSMEEKLTMMETVILQDLGQGATNEEICRELNLKLPTVKSHIYSLYKKLNVNNRVQAVLKGKELGILK